MSGRSANLNELYRKALVGDRDAQECLFRVLSDMFRLFIRHRISDRDAQEEIVQTALVKIAQSYRKHTISSSFAAWAHQVLRNQLIDWLRQRERHHRKWTEMVDRHAPARQWEPDPTLRAGLKECLRRIYRANPRYARILVLHYQGYQTPEICEKMQIRSDYCRVLLRRARLWLGDCLMKGVSDGE